MAEIRPIRAWRYNPEKNINIEEVTSPLFDVVSDSTREKLLKTDFSSIHISRPQGDHPAENAKKTLQKWKLEEVIKQDILPAIYVYYQYFSLPDSVKEFCRKGFIINLKIHDWGDEVILRHENTIPKSVNDRIELLRSTELNVSPTHGLYTDNEFQLEKFMDEAMLNPIYETEDYQGVRDVMGIIQDYDIIKKFVHVISSKQIILADGHHRYESSLINMKEKRAQNPNHNGKEGYNYHLMYLSNTESDDLKILPTHRLISGIDNFNEEKILSELGKYFTVKPVNDTFTLHEVIAGKGYAFGLLFKENAYKIVLKEGMHEKISWKFPDIIKNLDLTVAHYYIIEKCIGIPGKIQRETEHVNYDRSFSDCYAKVLKDEAQMAIIVNSVKMEEVKKVCYSGYTLPQKSTHFYPKVITGFLFSSIKNDEFELPYNLSF